MLRRRAARLRPPFCSASLQRTCPAHPHPLHPCTQTRAHVCAAKRHKTRRSSTPSRCFRCHRLPTSSLRASQPERRRPAAPFAPSPAPRPPNSAHRDAAPLRSAAAPHALRNALPVAVAARPRAPAHKAFDRLYTSLPVGKRGLPRCRVRVQASGGPSHTSARTGDGGGGKEGLKAGGCTGQEQAWICGPAFSRAQEGHGSWRGDTPGKTRAPRFLSRRRRQRRRQLRRAATAPAPPPSRLPPIISAAGQTLCASTFLVHTWLRRPITRA